MIFQKKDSSAKASDLESKGDQYARKNKIKKALEAYREASELNPENIKIYENCHFMRGSFA